MNADISPNVENSSQKNTYFAHRLLQNGRGKTILVGLLLLAVFGTGWTGGYYKGSSDVNSKSLQESPTTITMTSSITPGMTPTTLHEDMQSKVITRYDDERVTINKLHIISLLFVPRDITTPIKPEWINNLQKTDEELKRFYEQQFQNILEITYQVLETPIKGDSTIETYTSRSMTIEAKEKSLQYQKEGAHTIWMIYLVRDPELKKNIIGGDLGGLSDLQAATQFEFWLDNAALTDKSQYGLVGSAHEFGHALGIHHPWELPANISGDPNYGNVPGDVMGYSNTSLPLHSLYIRDDVKQKMGLPIYKFQHSSPVPSSFLKTSLSENLSNSCA